MRLGEKMENHIWGDFCAEALAQNSMGAFLDLDSIECTAGYKIEIFIENLNIIIKYA